MHNGSNSTDDGAIPRTRFDRFDDWRNSLTPAQLSRAQYVADQIGLPSLADFFWQQFSTRRV
jgi:hypothetical protein